MKKSIFLMLGLCILCLSVLFISCDGDSSTGGGGGGNGQPSALVGRWTATEGEMAWIVTTNSNQTVVDFLGPGTGELNLTGAVTASLTYTMMAEDEGEVMAVVANVPITELFDMDDLDISKKMNNPRSLMSELKTMLTYPLYVLYIASDQGAMLMVCTSQSDTTTYYGTTDGLTFDISNYKLTANNLTLYDATVFPPTTVLVNGTLQNQIINIPANTPTNVMTQTISDEDYHETIDLNSDGSCVIITDTDFSEPDTSYGTWSTSGDTLTVVTIDTSDSEVEMDTTVVAYDLNGNNLEITFEDDYCDYEDEEDITDCLAEIEEMFDLDEGSVVSASMLVEMTYVKAGAAKL